MILKSSKTCLNSIIIFLLTIPSFAGTLSQAEYKKLDPQLIFLINHPESKKLYHCQLQKNHSANKINLISALIKSKLTKSELSALRVKVYSQIGNIFSVSIPINQIEKLAKHPKISYLQKSKKHTIHNDKSMTEIRAPQARQQYNVSGKGVIIGIVDTGINWRHLDFRNPDGTTRIKALLDFSDPGDVDGDGVLDGADQYGGTLYTEQEINNALNGIGTVNATDEVGHGTHVAGSAAGNGRATGNGVSANTFVGVAPEADLIIVKGTRLQGSQNFEDVDYINSIVFIDSIANILNKPYVINLSLGSSSGPHDGKDLSEQAIDALLTGPNAKGKSIVVSAGNEGDKAIHASGTFGSGTSSIETKFDISTYTANESNYNDYIQFDGWYDASYNFSVKVISPTNSTYGPVNAGSERSYDTTEGAIYILNAKGGASALNGDKQIMVQIFDYYETKTPKEGEWKIIISGSSGHFDLWLAGSSMEASLTSNIDYSVIVGTPGTAFNAVTVGAYITKSHWTDLDGFNLGNTSLIIGSPSSFSSAGPTRDGRVKPEICAPGEMIGASYSSDAPPTGSYSMFASAYSQWPNAYICPDNKHALSQGTSFSAPHVSGAIALLLQKKPNENAQNIRLSVIASAQTDNHTGSTPSDKWGYGKLDVMAMMQSVGVENNIVESQIPNSVQLFQNYPNPFNPLTTISYSICTGQNVRITVFNQLGQKIRTLVNKNQLQGNYRVNWDGKNNKGKNVPSGIYFYRLVTGNFSQTRKMILLQ